MKRFKIIWSHYDDGDGTEIVEALSEQNARDVFSAKYPLYCIIAVFKMD